MSCHQHPPAVAMPWPHKPSVGAPGVGAAAGFQVLWSCDDLRPRFSETSLTPLLKVLDFLMETKGRQAPSLLCSVALSLGEDHVAAIN